MRRVGAYDLWIGHVIDADDLQSIHGAGIEALVDLGINEPVAKPTRELVYCRIPLLDGPGNRPELLRLAIGTTAQLIAASIPTLVFCSAGMSRSPAIAAAALAVATGKQLDDCLLQVFEKAPRDLAPGLWRDVSNAIAQWPRRNGELQLN